MTRIVIDKVFQVHLGTTYCDKQNNDVQNKIRATSSYTYQARMKNITVEWGGWWLTRIPIVYKFETREAIKNTPNRYQTLERLNLKKCGKQDKLIRNLIIPN